MPPRKKAYKLVPKGETESSGSEGESTATRVLRWVTAGRYGRRERSESTEAQLAAADKDIHPEVVREVYRKAATAGQEEWMLWHSEKEIDADQEPLWRRRWKMSRQRRFDPGNQEAGVQYLPLSGDPIDFVLAWESGLHDDVEDDEEEERERANARGHFQARLRSEGLVTHVEPSINNPRLKFVLLHAPFGVLLRVAESLHLKMPIARYSQGEMNLSEKVLQKLGVRNPMLTSACEGSQRPFYRAAPVKVNTLNRYGKTTGRPIVHGDTHASTIEYCDTCTSITLVCCLQTILLSRFAVRSGLIVVSLDNSQFVQMFTHYEWAVMLRDNMHYKVVFFIGSPNSDEHNI
eukprot:scpid85742/ scgid1222/ 